MPNITRRNQRECTDSTAFDESSFYIVKERRPSAASQSGGLGGCNGLGEQHLVCGNLVVRLLLRHLLLLQRAAALDVHLVDFLVRELLDLALQRVGECLGGTGEC